MEIDPLADRVDKYCVRGRTRTLTTRIDLEPPRLLAGAVPLNVVLSVLAHTICTAFRRRLPGYPTATPDTLQRRFLSTGGQILNQGDQITIRLNRRTYSPILRQADLPDTEVPW